MKNNSTNLLRIELLNAEDYFKFCGAKKYWFKCPNDLMFNGVHLPTISRVATMILLVIIGLASKQNQRTIVLYTDHIRSRYRVRPDEFSNVLKILESYQLIRVLSEKDGIESREEKSREEEEKSRIAKKEKGFLSPTFLVESPKVLTKEEQERNDREFKEFLDSI